MSDNRWQNAIDASRAYQEEQERLRLEVESVRRLVAEVRASAIDPERAHGLEDSLFAHVLASIALGNPYPRQLAAAALESQDIDFDRWCA